MDCPSCATLIECELEDAKIKAKVNFAKETIEIEIDKEEKTRKIVKKLGYLIKYASTGFTLFHPWYSCSTPSVSSLRSPIFIH